MISMEPHEDNRRALSSDDDDEDDVADAKLRSIHFLKRNEEFSNHEDDDGLHAPVKPHRYDEMGSFLTRSQRSVSHPDMPPTSEEAAERKVQIKDGVVDEIHQMEPFTADETAAYFMGEEDFRRIDISVELTTMRWEKAVKNKTKLDEDENPTRGLEEMMDTKHVRAALRRKHRQAVLTEMVRQKTADNYNGSLNWERIRAVAEPYSKQTAQIAYDLALQDAGEAPSRKSKVFKDKSSSSSSSSSSKKKKGGLFGLFKKK